MEQMHITVYSATLHPALPFTIQAVLNICLFDELVHRPGKQHVIGLIPASGTRCVFGQEDKISPLWDD